MNDDAQVECREPARDLSEQCPCSTGLAVAVARAIERAAVDERHHEVEHARVDTDVEHGDEVWIVECRGEVRLAREPRLDLRVDLRLSTLSASRC